MGRGGVMKRFGFGNGRSVPNRFDSYIHGGKVAIKKGRVGSIVLLQLVHILDKELEHGWGSDLGRVFAFEVHELVVEGGHHLQGEAFHDVLDQVPGMATLWRSSTSWICWMISKLASRVLILGDRSSATSWTDS